MGDELKVFAKGTKDEEFIGITDLFWDDTYEIKVIVESHAVSEALIIRINPDEVAVSFNTGEEK